MKHIYLIIILLLHGSIKSTAQKTDNLDTGFGTNGKVVSGSPKQCLAQAVAIQSDGKIVVVGYFFNGTYRRFTIFRYHTDGTLDSNFNKKGRITYFIGTDSKAYAVAIQSDNKILAAGSAHDGGYSMALRRHNQDGTLDTLFGNRGLVTVEYGIYDGAYSIAIQTDGKIIIAGSSSDNSKGHFALVRFKQNGTLDSSFGKDGLVTTIFDKYSHATKLMIQTDGKIIAAGSSDTGSGSNGMGLNSRFAMARYNKDGSLDKNFHYNGKLYLDFDSGASYCNSAVLQKDGKIVASGYMSTGKSFNFVLARFNTDGYLDNSFGSKGKVITSFLNAQAYSLIIQSDGKLILGGTISNGKNSDFALVRYKTNGIIDSSFGINGKMTSDFNSSYDLISSIAQQSDGKIVAVGSTRDTITYFAIARYIPTLITGDIEFSKSNIPVLIYPNPIKEIETLQYTLQNEENISIQLIDLQGRTLKTFIKNSKQETGEHKLQIEMPGNMASGSYFIVLSTEKGQVNIKISK
jgi:uncharacterized delta-60 repeat protein